MEFIEDSYLQGDTYESCLNNVLDTLNLLRELGFVIHLEKSNLVSSWKENQNKGTDDSLPKQCYMLKRTSKNNGKYCCKSSSCNLWTSSLQTFRKR